MRAATRATTYFDPVHETQDREALAAYQLERFQALLREILPANRFYLAKLGGCRVESWDDFRTLPFTKKSEIADDQAAAPPFGTNVTYPIERYVKYHQTSGTSGKAPIRWLDTPESWAWWARLWGHVYRGAGIGEGDRIFFAFSFGPFVGFWSAFEGASAVGAMTIPGGGMQTEQRLNALLESGATALCCTPTYALRLAEAAEALGIDLASSAVRATVHAGEPGASIPQVRDRIQRAFGATCHDHIGMTEVGATGYTCAEQDGVHLIESEFIFEVIDPTTGEQKRPGERGELAITNLGRAGMPLIRYRTGDLVEVDESPCRCGRTFARLTGGILGRADDMLIVRGVNVFPSAIEGVVREFPEVAEYRVEVARINQMDELRLLVEPHPEVDDPRRLAHAISETLHRKLLLRVACHLAAHESLPRFEMKARRVVRVERFE